MEKDFLSEFLSNLGDGDRIKGTIYIDDSDLKTSPDKIRNFGEYNR